MKTNLAHYYYQQQCAQIEVAKLQPQKPRLLLHTCCAPCATFPLELLAPWYEITLYYENSNIDPFEEYLKRRDELLHYVEQYNQTHDRLIRIVVPPYEGAEFQQKLSLRATDPEGKGRCRYCYALRLKAAFDYAKQHQFDWVGTTMTISRQKDALALNKIGAILERQFEMSPRYFYSNFKKAGGLELATKRVKAANLYRQNYCGCRFSRMEKEAREFQKQQTQPPSR